MTARNSCLRNRWLLASFAACGLALSAPPANIAATIEERLAALEQRVVALASENANLREELSRIRRAEPVPAAAAEPPAPPRPAPVVVQPLAKVTQKLSLGGRFQVQYAALGTDVDNGTDPASTNHFFVRRAYLTTRSVFNDQWSAGITYDLAGSYFDLAAVRYKGAVGTFDIGLRKVNFANEEKLSSGSLLAIERSGATRYFAEANNGRRLGAASYRLGLFHDGKSGPFTYGLAVTNPERTGASTSTGGSASNQLAYWGDIGIDAKLEDGTARVGAAFGFLPEQGGRTPGTGSDLLVGSLYTDTTLGRINLFAEFLYADAQHAQPWGFYVQPTLRLSNSLEGVVRLSYVDSDGRGVDLSDGITAAPSGGTMDKLLEAYLGANWYLIGNDLRIQGGVVFGRTEDTVSGAPARAETFGLRSMLQLQY